MFTPKPHVSAALRHLWFSVLFTAVTLGACVGLQTVVWACVHFTDMRWSEIEVEQTRAEPLKVVKQQAGALAGGRIAAGEDEPAGAQQPAPVNRVLSRHDRWFRLMSGLAQTIGVISAVVLGVLMIQGTLVAAGGGVPGVERAVTATTWTIILALTCLPLSSILPAMPFGGVFASYDHLAATSEAIRAGDPNASKAVFYGQHFLLPMAALGAIIIVLYRFRTGVEQGVIATSVSELDEKLAREMSSIKMAATTAPRAVGALHQAIGETPVEDFSPSIARGMRDANKADARTARRIMQPAPGESLERPI